ncbi:MAG: nitroreductase family protein [Planctomycetaceae bacterium]|jgi:nitroreductase|nr:nitroreductase family protein [Planctomycetaceae bacterium]
MKTFSLVIILACVSLTAFAHDITLPAPQRSGGKPVTDLINERQSCREFAETPLDLQTISDLLWAAYGFNREDKRVIPTGLNKQELDVYIITKEGAYLYDAANNKLILKTAGDHRQFAGKQSYAQQAPVNFFYVNDETKGNGGGSYLSAGCAVQDVYLTVGSKGLGCTIRMSFESEPLKKLFKLNERQNILAAQSIGQKK